MDLNEYIPALKYGASIQGDMTFNDDGGTMYSTNGTWLISTVSVGSVEVGSGSGVAVINDGSITLGRKFYMAGFRFYYPVAVSGGGWYLKDTTGTKFCYVGTTGSVEAGAFYGPYFDWSTGTAKNCYNAFYFNYGTAARKGIYVVSDGTAMTPAGSTTGTAYVTVWGVVK